MARWCRLLLRETEVGEGGQRLAHVQGEDRGRAVRAEGCQVLRRDRRAVGAERVHRHVAAVAPRAPRRGAVREVELQRVGGDAVVGAERVQREAFRLQVRHGGAVRVAVEVDAQELRGHARVIEVLLRRGANAHVADEDARTPLSDSENKKHTAVSSLLRGATTA